MNHFDGQLDGQPKFEIHSIIEQEPFESSAVQSFFSVWCMINDDIRPQFVEREEWEKRGSENILEKDPDDKWVLYIPKDLKLWEMVGVMEKVDIDTFATKPERQTEAKEKILELAKNFTNSGIYIAQRLPKIQQGQGIAKALALEFYEYGQALTEGKRSRIEINIDDIASQNISLEEIEAVDHFLAGDTLYKSRQKRVEQATTKSSVEEDELYEAERQRTLEQFFRVAEKAFALENRRLPRNMTQLKPWQSDTPIHSTFLKRIEEAMKREIETPREELDSAIFRRGLEKLTNEMKERGWRNAINNLFKGFGLDLEIEQRKLIDILHIPDLKAELEEIRQTGDLVKISQKERDIAHRIQKAVSKFPYKPIANNPAGMIKKQYINCVGASTLGGALMEEAGLNYLVGSVPRHSITLLVTADGKIYWYDMLGTVLNGKEIKDSDLRGTNSDNSQITVEDIVDFSRNPSTNRRNMLMQIPSFWYRINMGRLREFPEPFLDVLPPEYGQQEQILNNTGGSLYELGLNKEAIEAYQRAISIDPLDACPHNNLGDALRSLGRYMKAVEAYQRAISINPRYSNPHNGMGKALRSLDRNREAIEAFQKFIDLANEVEDIYWIRQARREIRELKKKPL